MIVSHQVIIGILGLIPSGLHAVQRWGNSAYAAIILYLLTMIKSDGFTINIEISNIAIWNDEFDVVESGLQIMVDKGFV